MKRFLTSLQILISLLLILAILFQQKGGIFGKEARFYRTLRGVEKKLFLATIILGFLFIVLGLLNLLL